MKKSFSSLKARSTRSGRMRTDFRRPAAVAALLVITLKFATVCPGQTESAGNGNEWPQLKGSGGFSGLSSDDSVKPPLKLLWSYRLDGDASGDAGAGVIVADGKVFVSVANSHSLVALDAENGRFIWEHRDDEIGQIGYLGHAPVPAYHDGRVILWQRRQSSAVAALDAETGELAWTRPLSPDGKDISRGGLPIADGLVFYGEGGAEPAIGAFDVTTGEPVWRTELGADVGEFVIGPTVAGGRVFVSTRANTRRGPSAKEWADKLRGAVTALDAKSGKILWRRKNIYSWSPMASDGKVLACPMWSSADEKLYLLDCSSGETIWAKLRVDNHYNPPITLTRDLVLYQPWGPKLHALSRSTGEPVWTFHNEFTSAGCCTPSVSGRYAYIGTSVPVKTGDVESLRGFRLADTPSNLGKYGTVNAIDLTTGKSVWRFPTANTVCGDPALAYGRLYFASRDGRVYCCIPAAEEEPMTPEAVDDSPAAAAPEVAALLAAQDTEQMPDSAWTMEGGGLSRDGSKQVSLKVPLNLAWKFDTGGRVLSSVAMLGGMVFASSESGAIFAIDAASGAEAWKFDTGEPVNCSPAVAGDLVYCGSDSGTFYALGAKTGQVAWSFEAGGPIQASPAIAGDVVIFGANDHNLYALDRRNGRKLWSFRTDRFAIQAPPVIRGDKVFAAQWSDWVYCLDVNTGKPAWWSFIPVSIEALAWHRDRLWARSPYYAVELDPEKGTWLNIAEASYGYGGMAFSGDRLYQSGIQGQYGTDGATFVALNAEAQPPPEQVAPTLKGVGILTPEPLLDGAGLVSMAAPLAINDKLCFATLGGELVVTDFDGKRLWSHDIGESCHGIPAAAGGLLVVGSDDGSIYAFREAGTGN